MTRFHSPAWLAVVLTLFLQHSAIAQTAYDEVAALVAEHFYDPELRGLDWDALVAQHRDAYSTATTDEQRSAAINALLAELGTSHTHYYGPWDPMYYHLRGAFAGDDEPWTYEGIGIATIVIDGRTFIRWIIDGTPAADSDLRVGDEIVAVDGHAFRMLDSFAGKHGSMVTLTIRRQRDDEPMDIPCAVQQLSGRDIYMNALEASARLIDIGDATAAYVHIWSWAGERYQDKLVDMLHDPPLEDADVLILDIRGGLGGANPSYLNLFNTDVPAMTFTLRSGETGEIDTVWRKPALLLIDGGSRSGKEVFAYGFKKAGDGAIIGERTAGAVVGGRVFELSDAGVLYLAVMDVHVDGKRLEGVGVEPDIRVPFELPYASGADPQLERAIQEIERAVEMANQHRDPLVN